MRCMGLSARAMPGWRVDPVNRRRPSAAIKRQIGRLRRDLPAVPVETMRQLWQYDDIILQCRRPPDLEEQPDLPLRIRGAIGNVLETLCDHQRARCDPFDREDAHELFYFWPAPKVDTVFGRLELAVPWIIRTTVRADQIWVTIRLFGEAAIHRNQIMAAAHMALNGGIALRNHGARTPISVQQVYWHRFDGGAKNWADHASAVRLHMATPLIIRKQQHIRLEPQAALRAAMRRVAVVAPWMGMAVTAEGSQLDDRVNQLEYHMDIHPENWTRTSSRAPGRSIAVHAIGGWIAAQGDMSILLPWLQLAEYASIGSECASGFGAFDMTIWP